MKTRVYLDNCSLNRPFDKPLTPVIQIEVVAKVDVQQQIRAGKIELAWSFILDHEITKNPYPERKQAIVPWKHQSVVFIGPGEDIRHHALTIRKSGIKVMDALHIACAIKAKCQYFLTTDKQVFKKKKIDGIILMNPVDFVREAEGKMK